MRKSVYALLIFAVFLASSSIAQAKFYPTTCVTTKRMIAFKNNSNIKFLGEAIHLEQFIPGVKDRAVKKLIDAGFMFNIEPGTRMKMIDWTDNSLQAIWVQLPDGQKACILHESIDKKRGLCDCSDE